MKIWENFKNVADFKKFSKGLPCRQKCELCKLSWSRSNTSYVHYIAALTPGGKEKYICDGCLFFLQSFQKIASLIQDFAKNILKD